MRTQPENSSDCLSSKTNCLSRLLGRCQPFWRRGCMPLVSTMLGSAPTHDIERLARRRSEAERALFVAACRGAVPISGPQGDTTTSLPVQEALFRVADALGRVQSGWPHSWFCRSGNEWMQPTKTEIPTG